MLEPVYRADSKSAAREGMWVRSPPAAPRPTDSPWCSVRATGKSPCADLGRLSGSYALLLGLYLGDGHLSRGPRDVWRLRITLDANYPGVMERCAVAISEVRGRRPGWVRRVGCVDASSYWKHWVCVFPQHGPGPKHERVIRLAAWQTWLVEKYTAEFLAGLIQSDGCRVTNRVKGRAYPRYFFSNLSPDVRGLFRMACEIAGIECRPNRPNCLSVARRGSVELLDRLIGPKN